VSPEARLERARLVVAAVGGIAFALSAPPVNLYPAVLVGLGALFVALAGPLRARRAAWMGWVWATAAGAAGMRFIPGVIQRFTPLGFGLGIVALVLLSAFQALNWAAAAALFELAVARARLDARIAFGGLVLVAICIPTVFTWTPAGLVSPWPAFIQLADLIGGRGVSVLFAFAAALLATPFSVGFVPSARPRGSLRSQRGRWTAPALGAALVAAMGVYGALRIRAVRARLARLPTIRLGVVQGAVPARLRWKFTARNAILARLRGLTIRAERASVDLTLWPEAAYPFVLPNKPVPTPRDDRRIVGGEVHGPVLFGLITAASSGDGEYNAATIVSEQGFTEQPQDKMELLWFGETVPLSRYFPVLRHIFFRAGGLIPGRRVVLLSSGPARIGVLNCYEDTLPTTARRVARARPNLLVNVTNDAWFGPTAEPELHLRLSVVRAVETRLDLVRAVNLGVPAWVDASGTVRARGRDDRESLLIVTPALNDMSPTLYTRVGDIPLFASFALALAGAWLVARRSRQRRQLTEPDPSDS
jgi:apolipoprotein N-acyltransferase